MATGSSSWDMIQRRPRAKLGGVSLNMGTKSQLVSVEGISDADAEKIMHLRGSSGELSFTTLLLETNITEEQMLQWARDKVVMGHFKDFDLEVEAGAPLPLDYLGKTVAQLSLEMKELSSRMMGVEDGHHQLSGNLKHVGDTAGRGLALASQMSDSQDQFIQSMESQQEEMMTMLAQKQKSFWESMKCQLAEQKKTIADIQQRQEEVLKELPDQDAGPQNAGLQTTGQTSSPVPSLSWDYRLGALRAQQDQLLADQEAMMSCRTSTPTDERTFLKHPMQGVTGGVHAGDAGYLEMATLRPTQPARPDMVPGHLQPFRLMEFPDSRQRDTDGQGGRQVGTGYPFRDTGDPPPYLPSRLQAQDDGYQGDPSVPQPYRQSHMTLRQRTQEGGYPSDLPVPQPKMEDLRPHYQKTGLKDIGEASRRERKQARKEFYTQTELQQKTSRRSTSRDSSDSSSSDHHRRSRKRKDKKHKKKRRHQRHGRSSDASLDRNWGRKDRGRPLNVSKLSSEDSDTSSESPDERRGRRAPPLPKLPTFHGKQPDWQGFLFQFRELARAGKWSTREKHDRLLACLKGKAVAYIQSRPRSEQRDYYTLRDTLNKRYGLVELPTTARRQLQSLKQEETETLDDFADRVLIKAAEGFPDVSDQVLQGLAVENFLRVYRDKAAAFTAAEQNPDTLNEAMQDLRSASANLKAFGRSSSVAVRQVTFKESDDSCGKDRKSIHSAEQQELLGEIRDLLKRSSRESAPGWRRSTATSPPRSRSPSPQHCYVCQQLGHFARDCKEKPICYRCRKPGHLAAACPEKGENRTPPGSPKGTNRDSNAPRRDGSTPQSPK